MGTKGLSVFSSLLALFLYASSFLKGVYSTPCPVNACPDLTANSLDLSPLTGTWDTVFFSQPEGSLEATEPHFFNISICGKISSSTQCSTNSSVCYSTGLDTFYNLGNTSTCDYEYIHDDSTQKSIRLTYEFENGLSFGSGNVTITLICGRSLGVPEVVEGDPFSHAIEIIWITSAACKTDSELHVAATHESKCYHIMPYNDNGIKARFIDLQNLIKPEGYIVSSADRTGAKFVLSICRPLNRTGTCNGSMACLLESHPDSHFSSAVSAPLVLGNVSGEESKLHMDNNILSVVYSQETKRSCSGHKSSVKINFLCPTGSEDLGPHISFLDNDLCLTVVDWYTSYACGNAAIQTRGCQLTTDGGMTFDLTGLTSFRNISSGSQQDINGQSYLYSIDLCGDSSLNTECPRDNGDVRVVQLDSQLHCKSLGVGRGILTYADGELIMTYSLGDTCHTNFARTSVINFICPKNVDKSLTNSSVSFVGETNCFYEFEWVTDLACGSEVAGVSSCQFNLNENSYSFAPLVGTANENWVALETDSNTACFMINPCGDLAVTDETYPSVEGYCNSRKAPSACEGTSVCQLLVNGSVVKIGQFNLQDVGTIHSSDPNVVTIESAHNTSNHIAVIHYVCKIGDLTTPPIFVNITNEHFYEFHWATFAGCPTGVQVGHDCMVTHQATGFLFNLSSVSPLSFSNANYTYDVSLCSALPSGSTHCPQNTSVCQTEKSGGKRSFSLGMANSSLVYEDGTLKVKYTGGSKCKHGSKPKRNTTVLFICDNTASVPVINSVTEDYCQYVIEVRTKLACPPSYRATECLYFENGKTYDFSDLGRSANDGNWEARGPDGSTYYINVCQPLNRVAGCNPLASVCRAQTSSDGHTKFSNLGLASSANFTAVHPSGGDGGGGSVDTREKVVLKYEYKSGGDGGSCAVVSVNVEFVCNNNTSGENGPHFVSGGDSSNPCEFTFTWETVGACPVHPMRSTTCQIKDPTSNYRFDLSPLQTPEPSLTQLTYFNVSTPQNFNFHLAICGELDHSCNSKNATICQTDTKSHEHVCGVLANQHLRYFDGSLSLQYSGGDVCHHVNKNRSVLINFECDRSVYKGQPRHISEEDCEYTFVWPTALACQPRELECVAAGGKYDLRPLLESQSWSVSKGTVVDDYEYVIGGCRSLDFNQFPHCPQNPWMGSCRWNSSNTTSSGEALGYVMGDLVEISEEFLKLTYYNGDRCKSGNRPNVVIVEFHCVNSPGTGAPVLLSVDETTCTTRIEWNTRYACSREEHVAATGTWVVEDPVSHHTFNLTNITRTLHGTHTDGGTVYNYTIGLAGQNVTCPRSGEHSDNVGACQSKVSNGHNHSYALGLVDANSTLDYVDGELIVEYRNGDECRHISKARRAVITFDCELDPSRGDLLEIFGENECEYAFHVHTNLVCVGVENIGVECVLEGYQDLGVLTTLPISQIEVPNVGHAYVSVCQPIVSANRGRVGEIAKCPRGSAACLIQTSDDTAVHLGKPTSRSAIQELDNNNGVSISYTLGSSCPTNSTKRYSTTLLLVCNWNVPVGAPVFISKDDSQCHYMFKWDTKYACSVNLPATKLSKDICTINDSASRAYYNFTFFIHRNHPLTTTDNSGNTYYIQLCGTASPSLSAIASGCDDSNTGVCRKSSGASSAQMLVYADHKFVMTSHSPHVVEVVFPNGTTCDHDRSKNWSAYVRLVCTTGSEQTSLPIFQEDSDCGLYFLWQNSAFCVGVESCSAEDPNTHFVYNLDGLLPSTWTGVISPTVNSSLVRGGSFTMAICRNLNPFTTSGNHCSSPSGVCLHTTDGRHINLGYVTFAPEVDTHNLIAGPRIHIAYSKGDHCPSDNRPYHTDLYIQCAQEMSPPQLLLPEHGSNCSWAVTLNSPLACIQNDTSTNCSIHTPAGDYDFSPLAKTNQTFTIGNTNYSICLCSSAGCYHPGIAANDTTTGETESLGMFYRAVETGLTNGPLFQFHDGNSCGEHGEADGRYRSTIFMECNRTADKKKGNFFLQEDISSPCEKFFFWSTPFACLSEEVSCTFRRETANTLYDFSPLHSHLKPWTLTHGDDVYYINICGAIKDRSLLARGCSPDAAICVISGGGVAYDIAISGTQQIRYSGLVEMSFTAPRCPQSTTSRSYVSIKMVCGIRGLSLESVSKCNYQFIWKNPYACASSDTFQKTSCSAESASSSDNFKFFPTRLHQQNSYTVTSGADTYYVNLCGPASECSEAGSTISACVKNGTTSQLASTEHTPTISVQGRYLLYQMSSRDETLHVSVTVQCLVGDNNPDQPQENSMVKDNVVELDTGHIYYYFIIYTKQGCQFISPTPSTNNNNNDGNGGGGNNGKKSKSAGGAAAGIIITLVAVTVVAVVLVAIFYKKDRRDRARKVLVHLFGGKSSEVVKYHKLSSVERDEETALMGEDSEEEEEGSEVESDGGHKGRGEKQQSDEEMIDL